jgi:hypothetical protein
MMGNDKTKTLNQSARSIRSIRSSILNLDPLDRSHIHKLVMTSLIYSVGQHQYCPKFVDLFSQSFISLNLLFSGKDTPHDFYS